MKSGKGRWMNVSELKLRISEYFTRRPGVIAVYLFGSTVGGSFGAKKTPDVDIGVLLDDEYPFADSLDAKIKIEAGLSDFVAGRSGEVDVVILNEAPPVLAHEVIKCRHVLFERDREKRLDFEFKAQLRYFDTKPLRSFFWEDLVRKVREGKFGY